MRRTPARLLVALVVALAMLPAPHALARSASEETDPSRPNRTFRFFGSGFGHGLGMSQWGAYGLARQGWSPRKILTHFYSGTRLGDERGPSRLRIGLTQGRSSVRLEASSGRVTLRLGNPRNGDVVGTIRNNESWRIRAADRRYRIVDENRNTVDRVGGPNTPIFAVYERAGARVRVPEAGHTYNRGWIEFGLYACSGSCSMRLVLVVRPQAYLYGLAEVPSSWPMSALRAQAIAARTYAFTKARASQHRSGCDCALYASSFDQVYAGWDKEGGADGRRWVRAVNSTDRTVVRQGAESIQAFYMSSSGGHTEDNENVWGGTPIGYLRGVCDPGDYTSANPSATWAVSMSADEVTADLGLGIGTVRRFGRATRGVSGRIISVDVRGESGSTRISGSTLRSALGLRDDRLWVNANRQVVGRIRAKYDALRCSPGLPRSKQSRIAGGLRQAFQEATIYHSDRTGAHEVHGAVLAAYLDARGPRGRLGFPTTDTRRLRSGRLRARFEHGVITCDGGTCTIVSS